MNLSDNRFPPTARPRRAVFYFPRPGYPLPPHDLVGRRGGDAAGDGCATLYRLQTRRLGEPI